MVKADLKTDHIVLKKHFIKCFSQIVKIWIATENCDSKQNFYSKNTNILILKQTIFQ